jgi:predicted HTH transcriptional regulator
MSAVERRQARILALIEERGSVTRGDVLEELGCSVSQAAYALEQLRRDGLVKMLGSGRGSSYIERLERRPGNVPG